MYCGYGRFVSVNNYILGGIKLPCLSLILFAYDAAREGEVLEQITVSGGKAILATGDVGLPKIENAGKISATWRGQPDRNSKLFI